MVESGTLSSHPALAETVGTRPALLADDCAKRRAQARTHTSTVWACRVHGRSLGGCNGSLPASAFAIFPMRYGANLQAGRIAVVRAMSSQSKTYALAKSRRCAVSSIGDCAHSRGAAVVVAGSTITLAAAEPLRRLGSTRSHKTPPDAASTAANTNAAIHPIWLAI